MIERTHNQPPLQKNRKYLRTNGTSAEAVMWRMLKNRQVDGWRFRRQFSVDPYILDFYCPELRLCVELDGQHHFTNVGVVRDNIRTEYLWRFHHIRTLRFENVCVFNSPVGVLAEIRSVIHEICSEQNIE